VKAKLRSEIKFVMLLGMEELCVGLLKVYYVRQIAGFPLGLFELATLCGKTAE